jgi:hypothetical protein
MIIFCNFPLDSAFPFRHNMQHERDIRNPGANTESFRYCRYPGVDRLKSEVEPVADITGVMRQMELAHRNGPHQRYGLPDAADKT